MYCYGVLSDFEGGRGWEGGGGSRNPILGRTRVNSNIMCRCILLKLNGVANCDHKTKQTAGLGSIKAAQMCHQFLLEYSRLLFCNRLQNPKNKDSIHTYNRVFSL